MKKIAAKMMTGLLLFALATYAAPANAKSAKAEAAAAGQFLCLVFYETKDASFTAMLSSIETFKKTSPNKISIYKADVNDPANQEIKDSYFITKSDLPMLLVIAPNDAVTGGAPKTVTADQLKQFTGISELMLKLIKPLQEQKVVLVALQNALTKFNADSWAGVTDFASDANYKSLVATVKADPSAAGSLEFIKQCQLISPLTQATVVVLLPPGRIGKVLAGKVTKADILSSLQACAAGSSCKPGACSDRRFKQNITPVDSALDKVSRLQGVNFTWNRTAFPARNFPTGKEIGLIAQDVEPIIPEVVQTDAEGYKSISYDKLSALLIEAVKELKQKNGSQDSLIQTLNARIKALEGK
jgi:hypothetical protein